MPMLAPVRHSWPLSLPLTAFALWLYPSALPGILRGHGGWSATWRRAALIAAVVGGVAVLHGRSLMSTGYVNLGSLALVRAVQTPDAGGTSHSLSALPRFSDQVNRARSQECFEQARAISPGSVSAAAGLGLALWEHDPLRAFALFDEALAASPSRRVLAFRAQLNAAAGKRAEAADDELAAYGGAISRALRIGQHLASTGDIDHGLAILRAAEARANDDAPMRAKIQTEIARIALHQQDDAVGALEAATRAVQLDPAYTLAHAVRAHALLSLERPSEALDEAGLALEQDQTDYAWLLFADAQLKLRRADAATESYNNALQLNPSNLWALNGLGNAALLRQDPAAARDAWSRALELDPSFEPAQQGLRVIDDADRDGRTS